MRGYDLEEEHVRGEYRKGEERNEGKSLVWKGDFESSGEN